MWSPPFFAPIEKVADGVRVGVPAKGNRRALRLPAHRRHKAEFTPHVASDMKKRRYVGTALVRL